MRLFFILNCLLFLSCAKEATVKLPETKPLPVMYSYLSPTDSVIRLKLMMSSPLFSSNQIDVLAAVSDGDVVRSVERIFDWLGLPALGGVFVGVVTG